MCSKVVREREWRRDAAHLIAPDGRTAVPVSTTSITNPWKSRKKTSACMLHSLFGVAGRSWCWLTAKSKEAEAQTERSESWKSAQYINKYITKSSFDSNGKAKIKVCNQSTMKSKEALVRQWNWGWMYPSSCFNEDTEAKQATATILRLTD